MFPVHKLNLIAVGTLYVMAFLWVTKQVVFGSTVPFFMLVGLLTLPIVVSLRPMWFGIVLALSTLWYALPLPLLSQLPFGLLLSLMVSVLFIGEHIIDREAIRSGFFQSVEIRCMSLSALLFAARFAYDRPGSALIGRVGGAGQAFQFLIAYMVFLSVVSLARGNWPMGKTIRALAWGLVISLGVDIVPRLVRHGIANTIPAFYGMALWFLAPMIMSYCLRQAEMARGGNLRWKVGFYAAALGIILLASLAGFRSRPLFAVTSILVVLFAYRRLRTTVPAVAIGLVLSLVLAMSLTPGRLSTYAARTLSPYLPKRVLARIAIDPSQLTSAEMGWQSDFRSQLLRMAIESIKQNPVFGRGVKFNREEIISAITGADWGESVMAGLAVSGGYHDSVIQLAVYSGVPTAALFCLALALSMYKLAKAVRRSVHDEAHFLAATVLGYAAAALGQMLMNGGPFDFYVACVLIASAGGLQQRLTPLPAAETGDARAGAAARRSPGAAGSSSGQLWWPGAPPRARGSFAR